MFKKLAGALLVLWGGSVLYRAATAGAMVSRADAYGQGQNIGHMGGIILAVILVISGAYLVLKS